MIRHPRLRRRSCLVLLLALTTSGCINSDKFTSGRLPYGTADGLAATAPHDPFLTGRATPPNERHVAATAPATQPSAVAGPASQFAAVPAAVPQMSAQQMVAPQTPAQPLPAQTLPQNYYLNQAESATAPMTDVRQTAYTPSEANPFNSSPTATAAPTPPTVPQTTAQLQAAPTGFAVEQVHYEMPVGMPAEAFHEENPFAEVQGGPVAAYQTSPQIQPHVATDAWEPNETPLSSFAGNEFLPPQ